MGPADEEAGGRLGRQTREADRSVSAAKGATSLAFSRDGKRLAGAPGDGAVRVWDAVTGKEERRLEGEPGEFACPAFSPDGARIAVPLENGPIKVWDLASGREEHSLKADEGASYQNVVFSPDGKRLAAAGFHDLAAWDLEGEKPLLRLDLGKDALVDPQTLFFTPDGGAVEYVTLNPGVVFNVRRFGKDEPERKVECSNLSDTIAALSPDARRLALKDKDGEITLWDLTPGREVAAARWTGSTHGEYFGCLAFSGDGGRLINVNDEDVTVWDTGKPYPQRRLAGQAPPISSITLSRDGGRLAAGGDFGVVVWDAADGRTWSIDASAQKPFQFTPHPAGRPSAFSPDGKRLVCPAAGALRVWDLDARKEERTLDVGGKDVTTVAWAADGRITALTEDGVVRVWGEGAEPERTWTCPGRPVVGIALQRRRRRPLVRVRTLDGMGRAGRPPAKETGGTWIVLRRRQGERGRPPPGPVVGGPGDAGGADNGLGPGQAGRDSYGGRGRRRPRPEGQVARGQRLRPQPRRPPPGDRPQGRHGAAMGRRFGPRSPRHTATRIGIGFLVVQ